MRLIIDVMSGDENPRELILGAIDAKNKLGVDITLVGNGDIINEILEKENEKDNIRVVGAGSVVTMEDDYLVIIKSKKDSSMSIGLDLLKNGEGDAFISSGNTGALVAGSTLILRRIKGIKSAAIGAVIPLGKPMLLIDSGANADIIPENIEQFAVMGSIYMKNMFGIDSPAVGLLNNGSEETKGNAVIRQAHQLLKASGSINFIGNIEGREVPFSPCDVLVCGGYEGNIVLKMTEGFGKFIPKMLEKVFKKNIFTKLGYLLVKNELKGIKKDLDYTEYGGAPLLGVTKPVIKAHGNSGRKALFYACRQAKTFADTGIVDDIIVAGEKLRTNKKAEG